MVLLGPSLAGRRAFPFVVIQSKVLNQGSKEPEKPIPGKGIISGA